MAKAGLLGCLIVVILVVVVCGVWFVGARNSLVTLDQQVQGQWGNVQNVYQRRYDLIPNLIRTVEGAANFEKSTLEAVVEARSRVGQAAAPAPTGAPQSGPPQATNIPANPQAFAQYDAAQQNLTGALGRLLVVVERYPDLKSNSNFQQLQSELEGTENRIAVERRRYNEVVQQYNTAALRFPGNIAAKMSGFNVRPYFQVTTPDAAKAPEVKFNFNK